MLVTSSDSLECLKAGIGLETVNTQRVVLFGRSVGKCHAKQEGQHSQNCEPVPGYRGTQSVLNVD